MTEKVVFEFSARNEKDGIRYEIRQGEDSYTCSAKRIDQCLSSMFSHRPKIFSRMHHGFLRRAQKRARKTLNTLERMYVDFYGNEKTTTEINHGG